MAFIILLIVTLVLLFTGFADILPLVFVVGVPVAAIWTFFDKRYEKSQREQREKEKRAEDARGDRYYNSNRFFRDGYKNRPVITGDHFCSSNGQTYDIDSSMYRYCKYANTAICANCTRRKEKTIHGEYFYGVSSECKEYNHLRG